MQCNEIATKVVLRRLLRAHTIAHISDATVQPRHQPPTFIKSPPPTDVHQVTAGIDTIANKDSDVDADKMRPDVR